MRSLRARLYALWLLLVGSAAATGFLLYEFYAQSAAVQLAQAEVEVARACRDIADRYAFYVAGWTGPGEAGIDDKLRQDLTAVVSAALARATGMEGGLWSERAASIAYAYPTYEGSGPKTDFPAAELSLIAQVNADALRDGRARPLSRVGRTQTLIVQGCPVGGPIRNLTAWAMTRVFTGYGAAYGQLLTGLAVLAATVLGSALFLGRILLTNARRISGLERALATHQDGDLPALAPTGEPELDRFVGALNDAGRRLGETRARLVAAERLAALGRMSAGIAHEIRNPMAAMRLKAENALAGGEPERDRAALAAILGQIGRLDRLLGDLLGLTQPRTPDLAATEVGAMVDEVARLHAEIAAAEGVELATTTSGITPGDRPWLDAEQIGRAIGNLVLNAIQSVAGQPGATVRLTAERDGKGGGARLRIDVEDNGAGVPAELRDRLFEPFETTRSSGSGLGLSIVREIARAHGGDARLVPTDTGALFRLDLPWRSS